MFKKKLKYFYINLKDINREFFNFTIHNLFCKNLTVKKPITYNQKTFITGNGKVEIGSNCSFGYKLGGFYKGGSIELQARNKNSKIIIENYVFTNNNIFICAANYIKIGSNTLIGQNVTIMDFEAHGLHPNKRAEIGEIGKIIIDENVWIGNNVIILKNTYIGKNSIVAAGAVVKGTFGDNVIIGGIPARVIKTIEI